MAEWTNRCGYTVKTAPLAPGVLAIKGGGYLVHGKVKGKRRYRVVPEGSLRDAQRERLELLNEKPESTQTSLPLFATYAASLFKRKVELKELKSASSIEKWDSTLELHLVPAFGRLSVDAIGKTEIESWKTSVAKRIAAGKLAPTTANSWLSVLFVILREAVRDHDLPRDPTMHVHAFSTDEHVTYTHDAPNSLAPEQVRLFLRAFRKTYPQHFAMALLGFVTGLRPSSLRPLRRRGDDPDVDWSNGLLHVRRSNSRGQAVMHATKQGTHYVIGLPESLLRELRAHVKSLEGVRADERCELLFPSRGRGGGNTKAEYEAKPGMMSRSALDKPFACTCTTSGLTPLTPRGMRRSFQDLCRAAGVEDDVQKFICGHSTGAVARRDVGSRMTRHYSTFRPEETRAAIEKIVALILPQPAKAKRPAKRAA